MDQLLLFAVLGLGSGALVAGLALGVVVMYRGSGVVNLATGAIAMLATYLNYGLRSEGYVFFRALDLGAPFGVVPALILTLGLIGLLALAAHHLIYRPLEGASTLTKLVASVGLWLTIQSAVALRFGPESINAPSVLPDGSGDYAQVFGVSVPWAVFEVAALLIVIALGLSAAYRWTRFGLATRAAQENETSATYMGIAPGQLALTNTLIAYLVAAVAGVLVAPLTTDLDPTTITLLIVPALGAAVLAAFTSFSIATFAGIGLGVIGSLITYLQTKPWFPTTGGLPLPGVKELLYFLIIAAAVLWRGQKLPTRDALREARLPAAPRPDSLLRPVLVLLVIGVIATVILPFDFRQALTNSLIAMILCLSLVVATGFAGQLSLAQVALGGVAAYTVSKLAVHMGIGFPIGPLIAISLAVGFGLLISACAIRVRGIHLAIVSLAFAVAIEYFGFNNPTWGDSATGAPVPEPHLFGLALGNRASFPLGDNNIPSPTFGLLALVVVLACMLLVAGVRRSAWGQRMLAIRADERGAAAAGISVAGGKMTAFALSSALAGVAGVLVAYNYGSVDVSHFGVVNAMSFVAVAYIGGITSIAGAFLAGLGAPDGLIVHATHEAFGISGSWQGLVAGVLLLVTLRFMPEGLAKVSKEGGGKAPHDFLILFGRWVWRRIADGRRDKVVPPIQKSGDLGD